VSELKLLAQRRALVVLSADLQRAAIKARLNYVQESPTLAILTFAFRLFRRSWLRTATFLVAGDVLKKVLRRR